MKLDDARMAELLGIMERLALGDYEARWNAAILNDELDAVGAALNVLAEELQVAVAERARAAEAIERSERRHRAMLEAMPDLVVRLDRELTVIDWHAQQGDHLIETTGALAGRSLADALPEEAAGAMREGVTLALDGHDHVSKALFGLAATRQRHFEARIAASGDDEVVATIRDVTSWKDHEDALTRARRQAEAASRSKSSFLANMSHELRTPLNAIIGFSELLEGQHFGQLNERQVDYVVEVMESGRHLLNLINEILDISRIESGRVTLAPELTDPALVIESALTSMGPLSDRYGVSLSSDIEDDVPYTWLDPTRVRQILYNLLSNAVKFTPAGGSAVLRARATAGALVLRVEDTGPGIAPEDIGHLFKAFERLDRSGDISEGAGLGLALTRHLVDLHGGSIQVDSVVGKGTSFVVSLPLSSPETPRVGALVLVAGGAPDSADAIVRDLRTAGTQAAAVRGDAEAIALAETLLPDAIVLVGADTDGDRELAQRLSASARATDIPVIMVETGGAGVTVEAASGGRQTSVAGAVGALARRGVVSALRGVRVCVVSSGGPAEESIVTALRAIGCRVHVTDAMSPELRFKFDPQLYVVDHTRSHDKAAGFLDGLADTAQSAPVLSLQTESGAELASSGVRPYQWESSRVQAAVDEVVSLLVGLHGCRPHRDGLEVS